MTLIDSLAYLDGQVSNIAITISFFVILSSCVLYHSLADRIRLETSMRQSGLFTFP